MFVTAFGKWTLFLVIHNIGLDSSDIICIITIVSMYLLLHVFVLLFYIIIGCGFALRQWRRG